MILIAQYFPSKKKMHHKQLKVITGQGRHSREALQVRTRQNRGAANNPSDITHMDRHVTTLQWDRWHLLVLLVFPGKIPQH